MEAWYRAVGRWQIGNQRLVPGAAVLSMRFLRFSIKGRLHDIRRVGKIRESPTASDPDNEITEEIKQNSLRPDRILAILAVRCYSLKGTSIDQDVDESSSRLSARKKGSVSKPRPRPPRKSESSSRRQSCRFIK
jgi:hypothetical protein